MRLPLSWLKELVSITESDGELSDLLTLLGLEVDGIEPVPLPFEGVIVGEVRAAQPHPDADNLKVATVFDGKEELQVVCGAPNCHAGGKFPFAPIGARLGLDEEKPFRIKRAKLRGVESHGMLCSWGELGLGGDPSGIAELPFEWPTGQSLDERYGDQIIEISLTPNLGFCQSAIGIAREIAAATGRTVQPPLFELKEEGAPIDLPVSVEASDLCPRYACRVIRGVKVGPSPDWISLLLQRCGMRSVNNIVDITNFVMLEMGQPLHAFDLAKIKGGITVRRAKGGEQIETLDGGECKLGESMLAICDEGGPIAIAGIIGGADSGVDEGSVDIVLEAAHFEPSQVMRTARALSVHTESSKRFERSCDPNAPLAALDRAADLIAQIAGGEVAKGVIDCKRSDFERREIPLRVERVNQLLGTDLSRGEIVEILERLECEVDGDLVVRPPTYRADLREEIDLIEEVVRLFGYHNIEQVSPRSATALSAHAPLFLLHRRLQERLIGSGLQQAVTCNLISPEQVDWLDFDRKRVVEVVNPGSQDHSLLRPSLLPGLLEAVRYNYDRGERDLALFEMGQIHFRSEQGFEEESQIGIILTGERDGKEVDFYDLKGVCENLLSAIGIKEFHFHSSTLSTFHPGRQAQIGSKRLDIGVIGELHPALMRKVGIDRRALYAELSVEDLQSCQRKRIKATTPSPYPSSSRDWTVTLPESVAYASIKGALLEVRSPLLEEITLLDVYRSDQLGAGVKNVTLRLRYRSPKGTLSVEKVEKEHEKLTEQTCAILKEER